jgi:hypothetical protein
MKEIRGWYDEHFTNDPKMPQQIKDILRDHSPDRFDDQNPYSWMRSLTKLLLPGRRPPSKPATPPRRHSGISQTTTAPRNHGNYHYRGGHPTHPKAHKLLNRFVVWLSEDPNNEKFVEEKLTKFHDFIQERQNKVADRLLAWRDGQVAGWTGVLEERYMNNIPNSTGMQAPEAGSSEVEEQEQQLEGSPNGAAV